MESEAKKILADSSAELGSPLSDAQLDRFDTYLAELQKWSKKVNLTSLKKDVDIVVKHFLDSLTPLPYIPMGHFVLDLGSGGGLPGVPMKIARPDIRLLLMDSTGKKTAFLNHIVRELNFKNVRAIQQRAESKTFQDIMGGHLDVVIARAFGKLEKTLQAASPYLKPGGKLIVMKGPKWVEDKNAKTKHHKETQLVRQEIIQIKLPSYGHERILLIYEKE